MAYIDSAGAPADGCFLCRAAAGEGVDATHVVERTPSTFTLLNRYPYSSGHLMVAPVAHRPDLLALSESEGTAMFASTQRALLALNAALNPGGFNIGLNHGAAAGASVEHVHLHVVPRWGGDTNFMPVLADVKVLPEHLDETAEKLRAAYSRLGDPASPDR
jgi:ATP adenylyltransferase